MTTMYSKDKMAIEASVEKTATSEHGWKVVRVEGERFYSCMPCIDMENRTDEVEYSFGVPSYPKPGAGSLCVFDTEGRAKIFAQSYSRYTYFPCTYVPSEIKAWYVYLQRKICLGHVPRGTKFASSVTLCVPKQKS